MKKFLVYGGLLLAIVLFALLGWWQDDHLLFQYNLMEIITVVAVSFGLFYFTMLHDDVREKNKKIEDIIFLIKEKLNRIFTSPIVKEDKAVYLSVFKYIENKIRVLEKMSVHLKCSDDLSEISHELDKLSDFIIDNIESGEAYFSQPKFKNKIPNSIESIETRLDNIILKIYK